ncbi:hypothetical protein AYM39_03530 [Methylomonas sp. DH-1]|nr:hypothetical protein AYM39_03530 [Methylomonas sp. DH-1]
MTDDQLHFMVECMENWFFADQESLSKYFGKGFNKNSLTAPVNVERLDKENVYRQLRESTRHLTNKQPYSKGNDSFAILENLDPRKVSSKAPNAKRLLDKLQNISGLN